MSGGLAGVIAGVAGVIAGVSDGVSLGDARRGQDERGNRGAVDPGF